MPLVVGILCGDAFPHVLSAWEYVAGFLLFLFIIGRYKHTGWVYGAAVYLFLGGTGFCLMSWQQGKTVFPFSGKPAVYRVCIREHPEERERSILCRVALLGEVEQDTVTGCPRNHLFLAYFPKDSATVTLCRGDELLVSTRLAPPANNGNPDEFDYARYLRRKGYSGTAYVADGHWRKTGHDASRTVSQVALDYREKVIGLYRSLGFETDELAVLAALTVGDKEELSDDIVETYSVSGASHVLALSGLHIGFLYALLLFVLRPLWRRWRRLKPLLLLLLVLFLVSFAFFTGLSSSVVRSVIMFSLLAFAGLQPEKPLTLNTLAATAFLMLLCKPVWLFDVGFQLSFSAVAAIVLVQPKLYALWKVDNRFLRYLWGLMTVSVAAQLGTAPLVIFYFSRFSTHFLLTNLWVIPMVSLVLYSAVFLLMLTPLPFVQHLFARVVEALVHVQNEVLRWIERLPGAAVDDIWLDIWGVLLVYLFLGMAYYGFLRLTVRRVCFALLALLAVVSWHSLSIMSNASRQGIAFYSVRGCPVVHCMADNRHSWLACADSLPDMPCLCRALSPHWNRLRLETPRLVAGDYTTSGLSMRNQIVSYAGKRICLLSDNRWRNKSSSHPLSVDYLYVYRVGQGHYCPLPPSEPYVRVSPHTAQAFLSLCLYAETGSYYFLFPLVLRDNLKHSS
ncbi:ComEC/Rec2 family competence protein [Bacteroides uniformis]|uniref:ComEC/Rec2 family competence protein n=2 Tax=Bacteroides uniformis TaxID=820 RepID=UPI001F004521|nr:ComEC/Rec2 family competence protein [Bacteroides uniformis]